MAKHKTNRHKMATTDAEIDRALHRARIPAGTWTGPAHT
jgi:hypothetical protein